MSSIRRRCVFYVSGFDPKGARFYHGLYREQAALQSRVNAMPVEVVFEILSVVVRLWTTHSVAGITLPGSRCTTAA